MLMPWASLLKNRLLYQNSYASLLWIIQRSQQPRCRLLWYQTCFFFASLSLTSERVFYNLFNGQWRSSIFFYVTNQALFFRALEYYYVGVDHLKFSADYFRGTSLKKNTMLLPFVHFHLRAPSVLFLLLWYHSEQLRLRFFNDHVKFHDYLNNSLYLSRRYRLQRTLFTYRLRPSRRQFFRFMFLKQAFALRYRAVEFEALNLWHLMPSFSAAFRFNSFLPISQTWRVQVALAARHLPVAALATPRQQFFFSLNFIQLNLWSHTLLADDPLAFSSMVRLDWTHFGMSFPLFLMRFRLRPWLWIWTKRLGKKFVTSIFKEQRQQDFNFPLLMALGEAQKILPTHPRLFFLWWVLDYRINRFWNNFLFDRWGRVGAYVSTKSRARMFRFNYQLHTYARFFKEILLTSAVFGEFQRISTFFTKRVVPLDFIYWRMTSNGTIYRDFLANGGFSLDTLYRKLALDHYAIQRFNAVRLLLEYFFRANGFYFTDGVTWQSILFNPWSLRAPYYRLPDGCYDPHETRWSFIRHTYTAATLKFILTCFRRSRHLSLATFFWLLDESFPTSLRLTQSFPVIVSTAVAYRRYYNMYQTEPLRYFRRYPHQVYVSSRLDPSFRARWFSFADRMRRAGIYRSDLPYYPQDDELDIIRDLKQRSATAKWAKPAIYWIIR